jgi:hypothetical protein
MAKACRYWSIDNSQVDHGVQLCRGGYDRTAMLGTNA